MYHFSCAFAVTIFLAGLSSGLASSEPMDYANIPWPEACGNKTYCHQKPINYPESLFGKLLHGVEMKIAIPDATQNRTSATNDIACKTIFNDSYIYLIKDDNERVRLVAKTEHFKQQFLVEECDKPGRITYNEYLNVTNHNLHCMETKVPILLNVLSLDGTGLDSASPKGGIPFSCSTKKI